MCTISFIITPPTVQSTFNSNTTCKTDRPQKRLTQIAQKFSKTAQARFFVYRGARAKASIQISRVFGDPILAD